MDEFLNWYLAPWSRMNRMRFGVITTLASVPGLVLSLCGLGGGGGFLAPLTGLLGGDAASSGGKPDAAGLLGKLGGSDPGALMEQAMHGGAGVSHAAAPVSGSVVPATAAAVGFAWSGLVDNLILLVLIPLTMMRLRDMGKGEQHGVVLFALLLVLTYSGTLADLLGLFGLDLGIGGTIADGLSFIMWLWLCSAKTKVHEVAKDSPLLATVRDYNGATDYRVPPKPVYPQDGSHDGTGQESTGVHSERGPDPKF